MTKPAVRDAGAPSRPWRHRRIAGAAVPGQPGRDGNRHRCRRSRLRRAGRDANSRRSPRAGATLRCRITRGGVVVEVGPRPRRDDVVARRASVRSARRAAGPSPAFAPIAAGPCSCVAEHGRADGLGPRSADRRRRGGAVPPARATPRSTRSSGCDRGRRRRLLLTRLEAESLRRLDADLGRPSTMTRCRARRCRRQCPAEGDGVGIVAAGTSDVAVALEASRTLAFAGHEVDHDRRCRRRRPLAADRPTR